MTDDTEHTEVKTPPRDPYRGVRKAAIALVIFAVLWLIFGQAVPHLFLTAPAPAPSPVTTDSELQQRIGRLEAKIGALEDTLASTPAGDGSLTDARLTALQSKLEALQQAPPADAHGDARVAQLEASVTAMQQQLSDIQSKNQQQLLALSALQEMKDTVQRGEAFGEALQQLTQLAGENERAQALLGQMAPYARSGVSLSQLQAMFETTVPKALAADEDNIFKRNLRSLISIRKVGDSEGSDDESVIARAETKLNRGDVEASVKELAALSPSAGGRFATWVNKAKIWMYLRNKLDALQLALVEPNTALPAAAPAPAEAPPEASPSAGHSAPAQSSVATPLPPLPPLPAQSFPPAHSE